MLCWYIYMMVGENAYDQFSYHVSCLNLDANLSLSSASRRGFIKKHCGILGFFMMEEGNSDIGYVCLGPHIECTMLMYVIAKKTMSDVMR